MSRSLPLIHPDREGSSHVPREARRGRGAASNTSGRFEALHRESFDDGWGDDDPPPKLKTTVTKETARHVISRNQSPDVPFDRAINPYRGCEHGCVYCYARPAHAFMGLSAGLDFESKLFAKTGAGAVLRRELSKRGYDPAPVALGSNTDPYQPIERDYSITREILEVLSAFNHPLTIVTKSHMVLRDLDILTSLAERDLVKVSVSITTLDRSLARSLEPRAPSPPRRLEAIEGLTRAGIPTGVMFAPVIPCVNEQELEQVLKVSHEAGAREAGYVLLRLPHEVRDLFRDWLEENAPDKTAHVFSLLKSMREGREYDSRWFHRFRGKGAYGLLLRKRFELACRRLGLNADRKRLDVSRFSPPDRRDQMSLL